jgi:hypothetical protein
MVQLAQQEQTVRLVQLDQLVDLMDLSLYLIQQ